MPGWALLRRDYWSPWWLTSFLGACAVVGWAAARAQRAIPTWMIVAGAVLVVAGAALSLIVALQLRTLQRKHARYLAEGQADLHRLGRMEIAHIRSLSWSLAGALLAGAGTFAAFLAGLSAAAPLAVLGLAPGILLAGGALFQTGSARSAVLAYVPPPRDVPRTRADALRRLTPRWHADTANRMVFAQSNASDDVRRLVALVSHPGAFWPSIAELPGHASRARIGVLGVAIGRLWKELSGAALLAWVLAAIVPFPALPPLPSPFALLDQSRSPDEPPSPEETTEGAQESPADSQAAGQASGQGETVDSEGAGPGNSDGPGDSGSETPSSGDSGARRTSDRSRATSDEPTGGESSESSGPGEGVGGQQPDDHGDGYGASHDAGGLPQSERQDGGNPSSSGADHAPSGGDGQQGSDSTDGHDGDQLTTSRDTNEGAGNGNPPSGDQSGRPALDAGAGQDRVDPEQPSDAADTGNQSNGRATPPESSDGDADSASDSPATVASSPEGSQNTATETGSTGTPAAQGREAPDAAGGAEPLQPRDGAGTEGTLDGEPTTPDSTGGGASSPAEFPASEPTNTERNGAPLPHGQEAQTPAGEEGEREAAPQTGTAPREIVGFGREASVQDEPEPQIRALNDSNNVEASGEGIDLTLEAAGWSGQRDAQSETRPDVQGFAAPGGMAETLVATPPAQDPSTPAPPLTIQLPEQAVPAWVRGLFGPGQGATP